jgi:hypothetical protein
MDFGKAGKAGEEKDGFAVKAIREIGQRKGRGGQGRRQPWQRGKGGLRWRNGGVGKGGAPRGMRGIVDARRR